MIDAIVFYKSPAGLTHPAVLQEAPGLGRRIALKMLTYAAFKQLTQLECRQEPHPSCPLFCLRIGRLPQCCSKKTRNTPASYKPVATACLKWGVPQTGGPVHKHKHPRPTPIHPLLAQLLPVAVPGDGEHELPRGCTCGGLLDCWGLGHCQQPAGPGLVSERNPTHVFQSISGRRTFCA